MSNIAKLIISVAEIASEESYYPELKRKSYIRRLYDNLLFVLQNRGTNPYYNAYGEDIVGNSDGFIDYPSFKRERNKANHLGKIDSQVILLRDKFLFYKYMKANHMPVPEVFGIIVNGIIYDTDFHKYDMGLFAKAKEYFVKIIDGECASFVKHVNDYNEFLSISESFTAKRYICQRRVRQHHEMNALNHNAVNTIRIVTVNNGKAPVYVLSSVLRCGTGKSGNADNWAIGGLVIGIEPDGRLKEWGYYKPKYGTKTNTHPDSGKSFKEFKIPMFSEAVGLACRAHSFLYGIHSVGWDVAISEDGPVFIEGNDNFGLFINQVADRGLKKDWEESLV